MFDCDGLLVDSAACWEQAYRAVCGEAEIDVAALAGASVAHAARELGRAQGRPVEESRLRRALDGSFAAGPPTALPGARMLVAALAARIPLAVATNAPRQLVIGVLEQLSLRRRFDAVVSAEEVPAHKPAPDVYLEACRRLGTAPSDAIAFEDSPLGARAARDAGLFVVAVPSAPGMGIQADLTVRRLDDARLLDYLGLALTVPG